MNKCYYFVDLNEYFFRTGYKAFRMLGLLLPPRTLSVRQSYKRNMSLSLWVMKLRSCHAQFVRRPLCLSF